MIGLEWTWYAVGGKVCPDCLARHGNTMQYANWEYVGLPGDGMTMCRDHCKCLLMRNELMARIAGLPLTSSTDDMIRVLGMQQPVQAMSTALQIELEAAGLGLLSEMGYTEATEQIIIEITAIEYIDGLGLMSLESLIDLYNRLA